jgi:uncharacterized protein (TIGR02118 family)
MPIKIIVLYPQPNDAPAFERAYHGEHMPLMRSLLKPAERTPTFKIVGRGSVPFYRMAEVHFSNMEELTAFASSEAGQGARRSSERMSTGGKPLVLICQPDHDS